MNALRTYTGNDDWCSEAAEKGYPTLGGNVEIAATSGAKESPGLKTFLYGEDPDDGRQDAAAAQEWAEVQGECARETVSSDEWMLCVGCGFAADIPHQMIKCERCGRLMAPGSGPYPVPAHSPVSEADALAGRVVECAPETVNDAQFYGLEGEQKNIALDIQEILIGIACLDRQIAALEAARASSKAAYVARAEGTNDTTRKAWVETELSGDTAYIELAGAQETCRFERSVGWARYEAVKTAARLMALPTTQVRPRIVKIGCGRTVPGSQSYSSVRFDAEVECCVDVDGSPEMVTGIRAKLIQFVDASLAIAQTPRTGPASRLTYPVGREG